MSSPHRPGAAKRDTGRKVVYPWPFFVAMTATLLLFFSFQALFPTFPLYIASIGGSSDYNYNGLATWVFALSALLTRPLAGILADRWGRKPVLVLGAVLFGSGPLLYALAFNIPFLLGVRVLHGTGLALFSTAYQAFIGDLLPPGRYGEGLGLANVASSAGMVVAPLVGEWAVGTFDFQMSFLGLGAIGGLGVVAALVLPSRGRGGGDSDPSLSSGQGGLREALQQPGVRAGALGAALLGMPFGAFIVFLPLLTDARELGGTGLVFAIYALSSALARPAAGRLADRWGTFKVALVGLVAVVLAAAGLAAVADRWALVGLALLFGAGGGAASAAMDATVQASVGNSLRGSAAAVEYSAFDLAVGFGSLGLDLLASAVGYGMMYAAVGGIVSAGTLGMLALRARGAARR